MSSDGAYHANPPSASLGTRSATPTHIANHHGDPKYQVDDDEDDALEYDDLNANDSATSSERSSVDLFPIDIWSIAHRRAAFGHRAYTAVAVPSPSTPSARATAAYNLIAPLLPLTATTTTTTTNATQPRVPIIVVWGSAARTAAARPLMRALFGKSLLVGTYPRQLVPSRPFRRCERPVAAASPGAVLRMDRRKLFADPIIVFAELPVPEGEEGGVGGELRGGKDHDDGDDDDDEQTSRAAELWSAVAGCAGSAGEERSQVFVLLDPDAERDCRMAPRMRAIMRLEGVEVPELVARIAEQGIPDPVDSEMSAEEDEDDDYDEDKDDVGGDGDEEGGVRL